jgi:hypothetical protein
MHMHEYYKWNTHMTHTYPYTGTSGMENQHVDRSWHPSGHGASRAYAPSPEDQSLPGKRTVPTNSIKLGKTNGHDSVARRTRRRSSEELPRPPFLCVPGAQEENVPAYIVRSRSEEEFPMSSYPDEVFDTSGHGSSGSRSRRGSIHDVISKFARRRGTLDIESTV